MKKSKIAKMLNRTAGKLDMVSNTLDAIPAKRKAKQEGPADEYLPGEFGPENEHQDAYTAKNYHKVPIGKDSMSKAIGKNLGEILSDLDFAQTGNARDKQEINVQAGKNLRKASTPWPFKDLSPASFSKMAAQGRWDLIEKASKMASSVLAADMDVQEDVTGSSDDLSTSALAESGDEAQGKPLDESQEGGDLQFYGTYPQGEGGGPDSGHHRQGSRRKLRQAAEGKAPVKLKQPTALLDDEPGDNVERDQELGGLSGFGKDASKTASGGRMATVYRPVHVPKEMHQVWHGAAQHLADKGKLINASSGKIDYEAINHVYGNLLGHLGRVASNAAKE
jgi:hypothetical protein